MGENRSVNEYGMLDRIFNSIDNSVYYNHDVVQSFSEIKHFSNELYAHSLNVAFLSMIIGINQYERKENLTDLFIAALLHDYGKLFISKSILDKTGTLTKDERKTIELHSIVGYFYLKQQTSFNDELLNAVLDHHEKVDGSGYGLGKTNINISPYAKIISIADVVDAMVSDRVYRKKLERGIVYNYLLSNTGKHFEHVLVKQFINLTINMNIFEMEKMFRENLCFEKMGYKKEYI